MEKSYFINILDTVKVHLFTSMCLAVKYNCHGNRPFVMSLQDAGVSPVWVTGKTHSRFWPLLILVADCKHRVKRARLWSSRMRHRCRICIAWHRRNYWDGSRWVKRGSGGSCFITWKLRSGLWCGTYRTSTPRRRFVFLSISTSSKRGAQWCTTSGWHKSNRLKASWRVLARSSQLKQKAGKVLWMGFSQTTPANWPRKHLF